MNMNIGGTAPLEWLGKFFGHLPVEGFEQFLFQGIKALLVLVFSYLFLRFLLKLIDRHFQNDSALFTYKSLCRYVVWTLGVMVALHTAGLKLTSLFTTGGYFPADRIRRESVIASPPRAGFADRLVSGGHSHEGVP